MFVRVALGAGGSPASTLTQDPFNGALAHGVPLGKFPLGDTRAELRGQPGQRSLKVTAKRLRPGFHRMAPTGFGLARWVGAALSLWPSL